MGCRCTPEGDRMEFRGLGGVSGGGTFSDNWVEIGVRNECSLDARKLG